MLDKSILCLYKIARLHIDFIILIPISEFNSVFTQLFINVDTNIIYVVPNEINVDDSNFIDELFFSIYGNTILSIILSYPRPLPGKKSAIARRNVF